MKYIRMKDGRIYKYLNGFDRHNDFAGWNWLRVEIEGNKYIEVADINVDRYADTIEELCDEFVVVCGGKDHKVATLTFEQVRDNIFNCEVEKMTELFGSIWTDKGLVYVAKMNDKGELELL